MRVVSSLFSKSGKRGRETAISVDIACIVQTQEKSGRLRRKLRGLFFRGFDALGGYVKRTDIKKRMERAGVITFAFDPSYFASVVV